MGVRVDRPLRGLGIPDARIGLATLAPVDGSAVGSAYTEAGPQPGTSRPVDPLSQLVPVVSAAQQEDLRVRVSRAGLPRRAGCQIVYRREAEPDTSYRQWAPPHVIEHWAAPEWSETDTFAIYSMATVPSTQRVVLAYRRTNVGTERAFVRVWDPITRAWGAAVDLDGLSLVGANLGQITFGSVVVLPQTERVLLILYTYVLASDDGGATWYLYSTDGPDVPSSTGVRQRAAVRADGQILLVRLLTAGAITEQWASDDLGVRWSLVSSLAGDSCSCVTLPSGTGFIVTTIGATTVSVRRIASPFDPLTGAIVSILTVGSTLGDVEIALDGDGTIYLYARLATGVVLLYRSVNEGRTWILFAHRAIDTGDTATFPRLLAAAATGGGILVAHQWTATPGNEDASIGAALFGEWANLVTGSTAASLNDFLRWAWGGDGVAPGKTWLPYDEPQDVGWTLTTTGGSSALAAPGEWAVSTVANTHFVQIAFGTQANWHLVADFRVTAGGSLGVTIVGYRIRSSNGVNSSLVAINCTTTGFAVVDTVTATTLGSVGIDMTVPIQIWTQIVGHTILTVRYRRPYDSVWTEVSLSGGLSLTGVATTGQLSVGHGVAGTATSGWRQIHYSTQVGASALGAGSGSLAFGASIGRGPYPAPVIGEHVTEAAWGFLGLLAGPGVIDEEYEIPAAHQHGVERIFPEVSPSPDDTHRTTDLTELVYAFDLGEDSLLGKSIFLAILGANYRTAILEHRAGGVWVPDGTLDLATGFVSLEYLRTGDSLRPDSPSSAAGRYLAEAEAVGGHVHLGGGVVREVLEQRAGAWTGTVLPELRIPIVGGEPAAGSLDLALRSGILVVHTAGSRYRRWRVRVPVQDVAEPYYETGLLLLGSVQPLGTEHGWDWRVVVEPQVEETRSPYGTSRRRELGPPRRVWTAAWTGGLHLGELRSTPDLDYQAPSADLAGLAARRDVWGLLWGLLETLASGERPVLALPAIPDASGTTITDRTLWTYGRLATGVTAEGVVGDEGEDELIRVPAISVEEIR